VPLVTVYFLTGWICCKWWLWRSYDLVPQSGWLQGWMFQYRTKLVSSYYKS